MNLSFAKFVTYAFFGVLMILIQRDISTLKKDMPEKDQEKMIAYLRRMELRSLFMWLFIMINLLLIMGTIS